MAGKSFTFRLITPQGKLLESAATSVIIPAHDGSQGQLPDHSAFVVKLGIGALRVDFADAAGQGGSRNYYVEEGFAQMVNNKLTVLTAKAVPVEQLSESDAAAELAKAEAARPVNSSMAAADAIRKDRERAREKLRLARGRGSKI